MVLAQGTRSPLCGNKILFFPPFFFRVNCQHATEVPRCTLGATERAFSKTLFFHDQNFGCPPSLNLKVLMPRCWPQGYLCAHRPQSEVWNQFNLVDTALSYSLFVPWINAHNSAKENVFLRRVVRIYSWNKQRIRQSSINQVELISNFWLWPMRTEISLRSTSWHQDFEI